MCCHVAYVAIYLSLQLVLAFNEQTLPWQSVVFTVVVGYAKSWFIYQHPFGSNKMPTSFAAGAQHASSMFALLCPCNTIGNRVTSIDALNH